MANNIKYAQNLVGDWNKDIYEPKKQVLQDIYQTNWNKISNDYNMLKDTLARNYDVARQTYNNELNNIQNESFNRMNAATIDLANRGLTSSGVANLVQNADTRVKGEDVNKALSSLLSTGNQTAGELTKGANALGSGQTDLANGLLGDLGGFTDADAANMQQYAGLVSGIAESEASRAASNAISRMGQQEENADDEMERRLLIYEILNSSDFTDEQKIQNMMHYANVPSEQAKSAVSAYNYDIEKVKLDNALNAYGKTSGAYQKEKDIANSLYNSGFKVLGTLGKALTSEYNPFNIANSMRNSNRTAVENATKNLSKYTYGDIYNILYGDN